jgi:hypothetical protein
MKSLGRNRLIGLDRPASQSQIYKYFPRHEPFLTRAAPYTCQRSESRFGFATYVLFQVLNWAIRVFRRRAVEALAAPASGRYSFLRSLCRVEARVLAQSTPCWESGNIAGVVAKLGKWGPKMADYYDHGAGVVVILGRGPKMADRRLWRSWCKTRQRTTLSILSKPSKEKKAFKLVKKWLLL